jgi:hypothetical protein
MERCGSIVDDIICFVASLVTTLFTAIWLPQAFELMLHATILFLARIALIATCITS